MIKARCFLSFPRADGPRITDRAGAQETPKKGFRSDNQQICTCTTHVARLPRAVPHVESQPLLLKRPPPYPASGLIRTPIILKRFRQAWNLPENPLSNHNTTLRPHRHYFCYVSVEGLGHESCRRAGTAEIHEGHVGRGGGRASIAADTSGSESTKGTGADGSDEGDGGVKTKNKEHARRERNNACTSDDEISQCYIGGKWKKKA